MTEKRFNVFDVDGTVFLEDHKEGSYHIGEKENVDIPCLNDIADRLNTYADENEELNQSLLSTSKELQYGVKKVQKLAKENEQLKHDATVLIQSNQDYRKENEQLKSDLQKLQDSLWTTEKIRELEKENEQLKEQNQEYQAILQDMGILLTDNEVINLRNEIADKLLKPMFKSNGFDVDIDTADGFTIIPKGDVE